MLHNRKYVDTSISVTFGTTKMSLANNKAYTLIYNILLMWNFKTYLDNTKQFYFTLKSDLFILLGRQQRQIPFTAIALITISAYAVCFVLYIVSEKRETPFCDSYFHQIFTDLNSFTNTISRKFEMFP